MLVIRLARTGRRNQPKFRVVVAEHSKPVTGNVVEVVGHYNPTVEKDPLVINKEAIEAWLSKGVQPSNTIARILNTYAGFSLDVKQHPARKPKAEMKAEKSETEKPAEKPADKPEAQPTEAGEINEEILADKPEAQPADDQSAEAQGAKVEANEAKEEASIGEPTPEAKSEEPQKEATPDGVVPQDAVEKSESVDSESS